MSLPVGRARARARARVGEWERCILNEWSGELGEWEMIV